MAVVETSYGKVEGVAEAGLEIYRGIPFAKPPVGALRFCAPEPPEPWTGVRDATAFGNSAPQSAMLLPLPGMQVGDTDEDCLVLNVWTPAADGARRPVLFWIHGGGFVIGSGSQTVYDGAALARRGDVVVVTINYRMGPLGFLFLKDLCPDMEGAAGNEGIRDQVAALRWVRDNIAAFGGDPDNVTISGESAGGMSVGTILGMPSARGLFQRAIPQSGATHNFHTRESATKAAEAFLEVLGVAPADAAGALRDLPASKLLDSQQQAMFKLGTSLGLLAFQPLVDGDSLPAPALETVAAGGAAGVSLLVGSTRDEWKLFGMLDPELMSADEGTLISKLGDRIQGLDAAELVGAYKDARSAAGLPVDPRSLFFAIETDRIFRIPAIKLAEAQLAHSDDVFMYRFDFESPLFGGSLGACHAIDLPFVFGTYAMPGGDQFVGKGGDIDRLAHQTMDAWLAFARGGKPGHAGLPEWPVYDTARRGTMILGPETAVADAPGEAERVFWHDHL